jgi:hypothetical protein
MPQAGQQMMTHEEKFCMIPVTGGTGCMEPIAAIGVLVRE